MTKSVFLFHKRIIIYKVLIPRIIGWVYINHIHLLLVRIGKDGEGMIVISLDQDMREVVIGLSDTTRYVLFEYRELTFAPLNDIFYLIFPDETISFLFLRLLELGFEFLDFGEEFWNCGHKKGPYCIKSQVLNLLAQQRRTAYA